MMTLMEGHGDDDVLVRLGIHDPSLPDAAEIRAMADYAVGLGATDEEVVAAARLGGLGPLALDLVLRPPGASLPLDEFAEAAGLDRDLVEPFATGPLRGFTAEGDAYRVRLRS